MRLHIRGAQNRKRPEYVKRVLDVDVLPIWKGRDALSNLARSLNCSTASCSAALG
jgi:hypothetical protein